MTSGNEVLDAIWSVLRRRIHERGVAATELCGRILHEMGALRRSESELWVGDTLLNRDERVLPRIARATGLGLALYLGNRRIACASTLDAGRDLALGAYADAELVDVVLRRREVFQGTLVRNDTPHVVIARPLVAVAAGLGAGAGREDDTPVGIIEAYQDERAYYDHLAVSAKRHEALQDRETLVWETLIEGVGDFLDDVARRLQLLALNGNIIAAQAGEHGRAFRVVCRELSTLAERSRTKVTDVRKVLQSLAAADDDDATEPAGEH